MLECDADEFVAIQERVAAELEASRIASEARWKLESAERDAAYNALPRSVKLARAVLALELDNQHMESAWESLGESRLAEILTALQSAGVTVRIPG